MLIALLYHKTGSGKYANPLKGLEAHFKWIASRFPSTLPGEPLCSGVSVCLTFDDAWFDFYYHIFPLLKKYELKALLAVPTAYIPNETTLSPKTRLERSFSFSMKEAPLPSPAFCTWSELREIAASPLIQIASHSMTHRPMTTIGLNIHEEFIFSKEVLEKTLEVPIRSFVYPFGKWNRNVHTVGKAHYQHLFRIGNAENLSWTNRDQLLYRINGDQLPNLKFPFTPFHRLIHLTRFIFNTCRGR